MDSSSFANRWEPPKEKNLLSRFFSKCLSDDVWQALLHPDSTQPRPRSPNSNDQPTPRIRLRPTNKRLENRIGGKGEFRGREYGGQVLYPSYDYA